MVTETAKRNTSTVTTSRTSSLGSKRNSFSCYYKFELYYAALDNPTLFFKCAKNKRYTTPNTLHRCGNSGTPCNAAEVVGKEDDEIEQVTLLAAHQLAP
ncbi:hypothetical protein SNOG_02062 [Parastagonospora nodorum SN15]|uniref:Uncharacterized protein n=1 Tax=Phaeosphaeria nodorum (strain SN15 / ATCC MYA-4574 / FGSC 10173) TaxID=321614 RepID=Q0V1Q2_PHANO|nr:hypothetical protein SNOG_02062 [Parastagonospora nodorum SN15]EAT90274.1 hypothetical protein SNOG_02062 [Parastagonospora nodorum SN15]